MNATGDQLLRISSISPSVLSLIFQPTPLFVIALINYSRNYITAYQRFEKFFKNFSKKFAA